MQDRIEEIRRLEEISARARKKILGMLAHANRDELRGGHAGGSLSCIDILVALYFSRMEAGDRLLLSKGHASPALYSALSEKGLVSEEMLKMLRRPGGLGGHPCCDVKGVDFPSGSLSQLISVGLGMAIGDRTSKVYVVLGDGELQEGQVWEAMMFAGHNRLGNLVAIIDRNMLQQSGRVCDVMDIEPLADKFRSFNWNVKETDGHDFSGLLETLESAGSSMPTVIIANTVKGKGVGFMENRVEWHGIHDRKMLKAML
jgi:transketolase